jgi:menaquinone-dependent protoporphyrinogen oxidase
VRNIAVFYATREGQTRRIAEYVATALRSRGLQVDVFDVGGALPEGLDVARYAAVVLAASIHMGKHERSMIRFVRARRAALERLPTAFLSVSLSQAAVEDPQANPVRKRRAAAEVAKTVERFVGTTRFRPTRVQPVAGALLYRRYGVGLRLLMRFISGVVGASTDTSRDHEYTDWKVLASFAGEMADPMVAGSRPEQG